MKTVRFHQVGDPGVLRIEDEPPQSPGAGEVAVAIRAIGLNRAEAMFRRGQYLEAPQLPAGLGYEGAGDVIEVGPGVTGFAPGDAVTIIPCFSMNRYHVYGERAIVPAMSLVHKPAGMSYVEGASIWMQYLTAWGALDGLAHVTSGDAVLITAASSSVGLAAIQIVNALGGTSIAVTRTSAKRAALEKAGAAHVVASTEVDLAAEIGRITGGTGARVAFDPVAGKSLETLANAMHMRGIIIVYGALAPEPTPYPLFAALSKQLTIRGYTLFEIFSDAQRFAAGKQWVLDGIVAGSLTPIIDRTFAFDQIVAAHEYLEGNSQIGKIVVTV